MTLHYSLSNPYLYLRKSSLDISQKYSMQKYLSDAGKVRVGVPINLFLSYVNPRLSHLIHLVAALLQKISAIPTISADPCA